MKKILLPLLFTSLLFAEITALKSPIAVNLSFELNNTASSFDTSLSYTHQPLLSCSPKLSAVYKIESSSKLKVIPQKPLEASTSYQCTYQGTALKFTTEAFSVVSTDYFKKEKLLRLSFNNAINLKSIQQGLTLTKIDKLARTTLNYKVLEHSQTELVLKINEAVGTSTIELNINSKLTTVHGTTYPQNYRESFNEANKKAKLDPEKKSMDMVNAPQMVALSNGDFALRIFVNDNLTDHTKESIKIEGIENFQVSDYKYLGSSMRKRYGIQDAYYYHDISSKEFKPNSSYKVTLKAGLTSYYRELKEEVHYTLKTPDRAKVVLFDEDKPYISNTGELAFSSINIDKATLIVERVLEDNLRYFMNFSNAKEEHVAQYTKEIFSKELILNQEKNTLLKQKFKLLDLNKNNLAVGVYKITLRYTEAIADKQEERSASKILFLSNLGITANIAKKQAFVSVFSLDQAKPIKGAKVEVYGMNNQLLAQGKTNADGIAIINKAMLKPLVKGIIVQSANDKNFLTLNESINSPSTKQLLEKVERFKAHVYFQSNIVRPKAKINALITVKDRDFISASKLPVKVVFKELYGKKVHEKVYHTDNYGLIDFNYQLDANDQTGNYRLAVYIGKKMIGYKTIKVEAFMPPKIENSIKTDKEIYQIDELMHVDIHSSYLFGADAANLQGKVSLNARPINYVNEAFKNYGFSNESLANSNINTYINHSEEIVLDAKGAFKMVIKNSLKQKVPSILEAMLGVTIMDDAQPVSAYKKVKIYPYQAMVGLKINKNSFEKGEKLEGKAVLIDPNSNQLINRKLYAVVKQVEWHYDYSDGHYNWDKETTIVDNFSFKSNEGFSREVLKNGNYIIEIHDRLGRHSASQSFDVFSWNYSNVSPKNNLQTVEIKFEDRLYKKGDTLDIQIKSPILEGQLLLTLEGEKVDNYKVLELSKGVAKTSLKITEALQRGLRVHATVIRATNRASGLIPFRAMGYAFVKPNREIHKIKIDMNVTKVSKSKTTLPISIKTSKPSKVLISIVDKGILQLLDQQAPKIFDYFNEPSKKQLSYYDLYDQLLSHIAEGKLVDFGAGDMLSLKQKHLAPDLGKRIKPFMIWSGILESTDAMVNLDINIPEFNGRAEIVVMAINEDSIGVNAQEIYIKDDVMIKPSFPLYALVGDKIDVPVRVFNTTKTPKTITLSSVNSDNLALELQANTLDVPANSSKSTVAKLSANSVGKGNIVLLAKYEDTEVSKALELPIFSPYPLSTKTFKGISSAQQTFQVPKAYEGAKAYINISDNLIGALRDDLKYLIAYPYGCAEQTSSQLSAMHHAKAFLKHDSLVKESENFILQGIKKLDNMQNYYGEFEYWEGGDNVSPYASLYAAQTLLEIAQANGAVKENLKKKTLSMLNAVASESGRYQAKYSKFHQLYAAYILSENHQLSSSTANMLYEKKTYKDNFLATFYMAAILKATGKEEKAEKLFNENSAKLVAANYRTYGNQSGNFESTLRDKMLYFIVKTKYFKKDAHDLDAIQKEFSKLYSTQEKAVALKAISSYLGTPKNKQIDVNVEVNAKNLNYKKPKLLSIEKLSSSSIKLIPHSSSISYSIELVKNLPKKLKNQLSSQKELSIKQAFIDANGATVDLNNLKQGDKFFSKITVVNYGKIDHVVVNQKIPACLSIINNNIKEHAPQFKNENIHLAHKEIQDDRILHFINLADKRAYNRGLKKNISIENKGVIYSPLLASSVGECKLPATIAEAMYDPRITDHAKMATSLKVKSLTNAKEPNTATNKEEIKQKTFEKKAEALVRKIYQEEMNSNNPLAFSKYFNFPLNIYFRNTNFTKDQLLADKRDYFKDWSKRAYANIETSIEKDHTNTKEVKVKISFDYHINNGKKTLKGQSNHLLSVVEKEGKLLVSAVELWKEK
ncbi:MAG: Alpha-2-macroglobulin [uncultured Sulfurovum sp.]|uniref:Alpha-2-macroglobulin n=1 Tax=uncultured Sulfurovum sp. TaxID=269237 RepID=A0A6S6SZD8_9BACT|nr:MAG: Alpha-2-macroglobulin [uncultured Sulfurovum sp.]